MYGVVITTAGVARPPQNAVDWLPDFCGFSWVAYACASSSLFTIISFHTSSNSTTTTTTSSSAQFRQVIQPQKEEEIVKAVAWSPSVPCDGTMAVASCSHVHIYAPSFLKPTPPLHNDANDDHHHHLPDTHLSWRQIVVLVQSSPVEAIAWTGSGDGIIAVGIEVVMWKKKSNSDMLPSSSESSWETISKSRIEGEPSQNLVSATWSVQGPVATTAQGFQVEIPSSSKTPSATTAMRKVMLWFGDGDAHIELSHPQPVMMIQWRPTSSSKGDDGPHPLRMNVLLTCCLDGVVRLWNEIDSGRSRTDKRFRDAKPSFYVTAVIEIDRCLNGKLGIDVFVVWAKEIRGVNAACDEFLTDACLSSEEEKKAGYCEWLIGVGPGSSLCFWAIHCLDNVSPLQCPRVHLWKKQSLEASETTDIIYDSKDSVFSRSPIFLTAVISRSRSSAPPTSACLFQLLPNNSFRWSYLKDPPLSDDYSFSVQSMKEKRLSCIVHSVLNQDGHVGNIELLMLHPFIYEVELAVSLDSNGCVVFWSLPTIPNHEMGMPTLPHLAWKFLGKILSDDLPLGAKYSTLAWGPLVVDGNTLLLIGHSHGIDCFIVSVVWRKGNAANMVQHCKIHTILFPNQSINSALDRLHATHLPPTCGQGFNCHRFLLMGFRMEGFHASSWEVVLHSDDLSRSGCCACDSVSGSTPTPTANAIVHQPIFSTRKYRLSAILCSPNLFDTCNKGHQVTSVAVPCDNNLMAYLPYGSGASSHDGLCYDVSACHLASGFSNGVVKLWRITGPPELSLYDSETPFECVGMWKAHQGPVSMIALSTSGCKIATAGVGCPNNSNSVCIWDPVNIFDAGHFVLEDEINLDGVVIALNFLVIGNGRLLLGVCLQSELRVYSQRRYDGCVSAEPGETHIWFCFAYLRVPSSVHSFFWGPKATLVLVHERYFCLPSQWSFCDGYSSQNGICLKYAEFGLHQLAEEESCVYHANSDLHIIQKPPMDAATSGAGDSMLPSKFNGKTVHAYNGLFVTMTEHDLVCCKKSGMYSLLNMAEDLCGPLPVYHPKALLHCLFSGNWTCAYSALKDLVSYLSSNVISGKSYNAVPQINLSEYFQVVPSKTVCNKALQWGLGITSEASATSRKNLFQSVQSNSMVQETACLTTSFNGIMETLENSPNIPGITDVERIELLALTDLLGDVSNSSRGSTYLSLDGPGRRFWVAVRIKQLCFSHKFGWPADVEGLVAESKLMAWALQSDSQDDLCNSLLSNEPCWQEMRNLGLGFWLTSGTSLRARMEKLARLQFLKRKDPKECALLYLALNRQQVLAGLFKISKDERDKPLVGFLSRNFQEEKNKSAALKNAYVLLGRHQLELAAAFFLLGGDLSSAIAVCTKNIGDEQLALVICELVEGTNGPVQHELILNYLLPSAIEKEDNWLASMLEWRLGKYSQSILRLLHVAVDLTVEEKILDLPGTHSAFLDPDVGQYCAILVAKRCLRNSIGESSADTLARWAIIMTSSALNKCGLPLEALGCLSPSISNSDGKEPSVYSSNGSELKSTSKDASYNWLSGSLASCFESHAKLNLAMQYISKIIREHPNWERFKLVSSCIPSGSIKKVALINSFLYWKMFVFSCNNGMLFLGYHVLQCLLFPKHTHDLFNISDSVASVQLDLLLKAAEEICNGFAHCVVGYNITVSAFIPAPKLSDGCRRSSITQLNAWDFYLESLQHSLGTLRLFLKVLNSNGLLIDDITLKASDVLDHLEYCIRFASAWLRRNPEDLLMMSQPISNGLNGIPSSSEFNTAPLRVNLVVHNDSFAVDNELPVSASRPQLHNFTDARVHLVPSDERWQLIGCCYFGRTHSLKPIDLLPSLLSELLLNALAYTSSGLNKEFSFFIRLKLEKDLPNQEIGKSEMFPNEKSVMPCDILWNVFASQEDVREILTKEKIKFYQTLGRKSPRGWKDVQICIIAKDENDDTIGHHQEGGARNISDGRNWIFDGNSFLGTKRKSVSPPRDRVSSFNYPKEVFKRNGELLEAICINSCDQNQVAVASNRKGLSFFNWKLEKGKTEHAQYIWSESDWPKNGWAGSESTPVPTFVSPGVGLGSKKGTNLGLGGATIGMSSLARPGKDLTGGGAFGIPGYAGIGASGLGWGEHEDFEGLTDPPATVQNISTRALASHPSLPLFLVGSINTHVYLWEFGKDKATATYGVLPAADVPPPYALASISALQFDQCGHRFATAAMDGTVCIWQLEVGGKSDVCPTESSLCFRTHASDVKYVATSGSILAAAGSSPSDVNVVIWDTLAPPATSQVSLTCHEGGARSLAVFDHDIGSASISPLILTGGKGGDVGLHDFRFIATGRTKRNRHSKGHSNPSSPHGMQSGASKKSGKVNQNGMLWYIPKAHLGSVTRISTIPNTSLFLTGSKDGDVKLWDAKNTELVFHWQRVHDKHTFLQPNSRGFGGVVRAAVTDIQILPNGFLTCGGDGVVRLFQLQDAQSNS
ncbi:uncharacterized protein LOC18439600 [Amborella trichopoda]|nr:uncharacterized protein LOC18439600 [Amborella trichopoda]|eukprot:XP_020526297.1 uncharacterized protein LOC18439600 [Amborella trichopoda]